MYVVVGAYVAVGAVVFVCFVRGRVEVAGATGWQAGVIGGTLWPFMLPTLVLTDPVFGGHSIRDGLARRINHAHARARQSVIRSSLDARVEDVVDSFASHLFELNARRCRLIEALDDSPEAVRARLNELHARTVDEIESGIELLHDLAGRVTLLTFSETRGAIRETHAIDDLLLRLESSLEADSCEDAGHESASIRR